MMMENKQKSRLLKSESFKNYRFSQKFNSRFLNTSKIRVIQSPRLIFLLAVSFIILIVLGNISYVNGLSDEEEGKIKNLFDDYIQATIDGKTDDLNTKLKDNSYSEVVKVELFRRIVDDKTVTTKVQDSSYLKVLSTTSKFWSFLEEDNKRSLIEIMLRDEKNRELTMNFWQALSNSQNGDEPSQLTEFLRMMDNGQQHKFLEYYISRLSGGIKTEPKYREIPIKGFENIDPVKTEVKGEVIVVTDKQGQSYVLPAGKNDELSEVEFTGVYNGGGEGREKSFMRLGFEKGGRKNEVYIEGNKGYSVKATAEKDDNLWALIDESGKIVASLYFDKEEGGEFSIYNKNSQGNYEHGEFVLFQKGLSQNNRDGLKLVRYFSSDNVWKTEEFYAHAQGEKSRSGKRVARITFLGDGVSRVSGGYKSKDGFSAVIYGAKEGRIIDRTGNYDNNLDETLTVVNSQNKFNVYSGKNVVNRASFAIKQGEIENENQYKQYSVPDVKDRNFYAVHQMVPRAGGVSAESRGMVVGSPSPNSQRVADSLLEGRGRAEEDIVSFPPVTVTIPEGNVIVGKSSVSDLDPSSSERVKDIFGIEPSDFILRRFTNSERIYSNKEIEIRIDNEGNIFKKSYSQERVFRGYTGPRGRIVGRRPGLFRQRPAYSTKSVARWEEIDAQPRASSSRASSGGAPARSTPPASRSPSCTNGNCLKLDVSPPPTSAF